MSDEIRKIRIGVYIPPEYAPKRPKPNNWKGKGSFGLISRRRRNQK